MALLEETKLIIRNGNPTTILDVSECVPIIFGIPDDPESSMQTCRGKERN